MSILESTVNNIDSLNKTSIEQAKKRLDRLIKPQGSLDGRYLHAISRNT